MVNEHTLDFEHVSRFVLGERLVIADLDYVPSKFADAKKGKLSLCRELEVEPGPWHAFLAGSGDETEFLLLCHDRELEGQALPPFDQAEALGVLPLDSNRLLAIDSALRDHDDVRRATYDIDPSLLPVTVANAGVACPVDRAGAFPLYVSSNRPRTVAFVVFHED